MTPLAQRGGWLRSPLGLWAPVVAYAALIFFFSAQSDAPLPSSISDKRAHFVAYMGFSLTVGRAVARGVASGATLRAAVATWVITVAYAATDEWHQAYVPGRSSDVYDWYADAAGAVVGAGLCWAWGIIRSRTDV